MPCSEYEFLEAVTHQCTSVFVVKELSEPNPAIVSQTINLMGPFLSKDRVKLEWVLLLLLLLFFVLSYLWGNLAHSLSTVQRRCL